MSAGLLAAVGLLGGAGALARFLLDGAVTRRVAAALPWGTFAVNVSGSFALGVLVGAPAGPDAVRLLGTGLLGAFTTFSTWALESQRLAEDDRLAAAAANLAGSVACGLLAAWVGRELGTAL